MLAGTDHLPAYPPSKYITEYIITDLPLQLCPHDEVCTDDGWQIVQKTEDEIAGEINGSCDPAYLQ